MVYQLYFNFMYARFHSPTQMHEYAYVLTEVWKDLSALHLLTIQLGL